MYRTIVNAKIACADSESRLYREAAIAEQRWLRRLEQNPTRWIPAYVDGVAATVGRAMGLSYRWADLAIERRKEEE